MLYIISFSLSSSSRLMVGRSSSGDLERKKLSKKQEKTQEIVQKVTRNLKRIVSREHIDWNQSTGQVSFDSKPLKGLLMAR